MSGSKIGGQKAAATNKARYGEDFYRVMGAKGGKIGRAERVVKRLKLGFPKDIAVLEAKKPTISISNWSKSNIKYNDYLESLRINRPIKEVLRRRISKRRKANV